MPLYEIVSVIAPTCLSYRFFVDLSSIKWKKAELIFQPRFVIKCSVTIQGPPLHSHFEHFVFFLAFDKAKNAYMWRGSPIRIFCMESNVFYVQARRFIAFHAKNPE